MGEGTGFQSFCKVKYVLFSHFDTGGQRQFVAVVDLLLFCFWCLGKNPLTQANHFERLVTQIQIIMHSVAAMWVNNEWFTGNLVK